MTWLYYLCLLGAIANLVMAGVDLTTAEGRARRAVSSKHLSGYALKAALEEEAQRISKAGYKSLFIGGILLVISLSHLLR